jgi:hypothetical protein
MIHRKWFFDVVRKSLFGGALTQHQVDGLNALLERADAEDLDYRQVAYVLATTFHETAQTMQPIAEYGKGKGQAYGQPAGPYNQCYYGRGFVQLTWYDNYQTMQRACGADPAWAGKNIIERADDALDCAVATDIIFYGMLKGSFTGKKLADYITASATDWYSARKIVNGLDQASKIEDYAYEFHSALTYTPAPPATQRA